MDTPLNSFRLFVTCVDMAAVALVTGVLSVVLLAGTPAQAAGPKAALLLTQVKNVTAEKMEKFWPVTGKIVGEYYTLLPEKDVLAAQKKAQEAGCEGEACLEAVRQALGAPVAIQLIQVDEGYFNPLKMWKATEAGIEKHDYMCSRCTYQEFQVVLKRLVRKFEADH